jgi:hypothetical protein
MSLLSTFYPEPVDAAALGLGTANNVTFASIQNTPIGNTTPAAGSFTNLSASAELQLPTNAPASPTAGDLYRVTDTLRYRDSSNTERLLLNATDNLSNLANAATARTNLGLGSSSAVTFGSLTANNGTLTASAPVLDLAQTWNASGTTFTALRLNVTNTNSSALSLLADFQVGGTTQFSVRRDGVLFSRNRVEIINTTQGFQVSGSSGGASPVRFTSSDAFGTASIQPSNNILELVGITATNAQTFNIYNTFTSSTNHERGFLRWSSNVFQIGTEAGSGGGTNRNIEFIRSAIVQLSIGNGSHSFNGEVSGSNFAAASTGQFRFLGSRSRISCPADSQLLLQNNAADNFSLLQFGGTTSSFPALKRSSATLQVRLADDSAFADLSCGVLTANNGTLTGSSTPVLDLAQTWNNAATTFIGLRVNITDTASATASNLAEFQVGGTALAAIRKDGSFRVLGSGDRTLLAHPNFALSAVAGGAWLGINTTVSLSSAGSFITAGGLIRLNDVTSANPVEINRDAADTLAQRRGTNAQAFRVYNTFTSTTSFERLNIRWATNECIIDAEAGSGGGTLRGIKIGSATSSLLGFYGATPVDRPATVADPTGGGTIDAEARTAINDIIDRLQELGLIA